MTTAITTVGANENVLSPNGETLYVIGTDGKVRAYSVNDNQLLATWNVGTSLGGADITADGRYLVVTEREPVSSSLDQYGNRSYVVTVHRLDLLTGEVRNYDFSPTFLDYTFFDVAVLADGRVLLSQSFRGSGWVNLKSLNLDTGVYTTLPHSVRQDSVLSLTDDRSTILVAEANISNAEIDLYRVGANGSLTFVATNGGSGFNRGVQDISGDGRFTANHVYGSGLLIFDANLKFLRNLANEFPSWQSGNVNGLAFDATGANLYVFDGDAKTIVQIATSTWTAVRTFQLDPNFSAFSNSGRYANNLTLTDDGEFLIVQTSNGIQRVTTAFEGTASSDNFVGTPGSDIFRLELGGDDTADGGAANDGFYLGGALSPGDNINGGAGSNDQLGIQGNYNLTLGANNLVNVETLAILSSQDSRFGGGSGSASVLFNYTLRTLDANVAAGANLIVNANQLVAGESLVFDGSAETDGSFTIFSGFGNNVLTGGSGNDGFFFGEGGRFSVADKVNGGAGANDQLGLRGDYSAQLVFNADTMAGVEVIALLSAKDLRFGAEASAYSYSIKTSDANLASGQMLTVTGAQLAADETLTFDGSSETDGSFRILGGRGADVLTGGSQNDTLFGGLGADTLRGGAGNDVFLYRDVAESTSAGRDGIQDFTLGDLVDLSSIDAISGSAQNDGFSFVGSNAFSGTAGELRAQISSGPIWLVQADVDGDGRADLEFFVVVTDNHVLTQSDFVL